MAETVLVYAEIALVIFALLNSALVLLVYRELRNRERKSMVSFRLHKTAVKNDFLIFFFVISFFTVAVVTGNYGMIVGDKVLYELGVQLSVVSSVAPLWIFYRWWRRFR